MLLLVATPIFGLCFLYTPQITVFFTKIVLQYLVRIWFKTNRWPDGSTRPRHHSYPLFKSIRRPDHLDTTACLTYPYKKNPWKSVKLLQQFEAREIFTRNTRADCLVRK